MKTKTPIIDPRIKRLDLEQSLSFNHLNDMEEWGTYEVFHQKKRGEQHVHAGVVHAPDPEMALVFAKEQYGRRLKSANIWVVKSSDIFIHSATKTKTCLKQRLKNFTAKRVDISCAIRSTNSRKNKNFSMQAVSELMLKMADDELMIGHRNSEWTGLGPILEEDIAFSSMAQDKIGHALALYTILHTQFGMAEPDQLAFHRRENEFHCSHFTELPIGEYDFSVVRHFLFDHAEALRYELLSTSSFEPLARLARKIKGELKYHVLHANSWITRLGRGTEVSHARMQSALNYAMPFALGMFEEGEKEEELISSNIFPGEKQLHQYWEERIREQLEKANLQFPEIDFSAVHFGGRKGHHTEYLFAMLEEMRQVFKLEENVEW